MIAPSAVSLATIFAGALQHELLRLSFPPVSFRRVCGAQQMDEQIYLHFLHWP